MNTKDFLAMHMALCVKMHRTVEAKNADYTGAGSDPFANFRQVENLGIATTEQGFLTRMSDKISRLASFVKNGTLQVKDESVEDTLLDLANYCLLMACYLKSKGTKVDATATIDFSHSYDKSV